MWKNDMCNTVQVCWSMKRFLNDSFHEMDFSIWILWRFDWNFERMKIQNSKIDMNQTNLKYVFHACIEA